MSENLGLMVGGELKPFGMTVDNGVFVFTPIQHQFLKNLNKLKNVTAAALSVGWVEERAVQFIKSRKFQKFLACTMQEQMTQASMTSGKWWAWCKALTDGYTEKIVGWCPFCKWTDELTQYEVEAAKRDDDSLDFRCPACSQLAEVEVTRKPFKKDREQVVGWQEWGARKIAKIERANRQYDESEIVFETTGEGTNAA